jgi:hypothetical protein
MLDEHLTSDTSAQPVPLTVVAETADPVQAAIDILMTKHQVPQRDAAQLLRRASEDLQRPLPEAARDVIRISLPASVLPISGGIQLRSSSTAAGQAASAQSQETAPSVTAQVRAPGGEAALQLLQLLVRGTLPSLLQGISELAVSTVPGCRWASVRVIRDGEPALASSSEAWIHAVDETQFQSGEGPCLQAVRTSAPVYLDLLEADAAGEWQRAAKEAGITATMSLPLPSPADSVAVLNLHSCRPAGWPSAARTVAAELAEQIGMALMISHRLEGPARDDRHSASAFS